MTSTVHDTRPKNLNLFTIHFPIPAIVSILHRISGVILFFLIPIALWVLDRSLISGQDFDELHDFLTQPFIKFIVWGFISAFIYHFIAGIRHLFMDIHLGDELKSGRMTSWITIGLTIIFMILTGFWLW